MRYAHMVESAVRGVEAVVHLAAVCMNKSIADPTESLDVNLMGTQNVFDAVARAGVRRIVYASSASVYGDPTRLPMREGDALAPITPYCVAKAAGEQLLAFYAQRTSMAWLALRFFNVYGPGQPTDAYYTSVINAFVRRITEGEPPMIDGRGSQSMDFVHVSDVAAAVGLALDSAESGHILNVGTGHQTSRAARGEPAPSAGLPPPASVSSSRSLGDAARGEHRGHPRGLGMGAPGRLRQRSVGAGRLGEGITREHIWALTACWSPGPAASWGPPCSSCSLGRGQRSSPLRTIAGRPGSRNVGGCAGAPVAGHGARRRALRRSAARISHGECGPRCRRGQLGDRPSDRRALRQAGRPVGLHLRRLGLRPPVR